MNRDLLAWGALAVACHALLLFGVRVAQNAAPLPMADTAVEVSLVATAPAAAAVEAAPPPPAPEPPTPPRPPEPVVTPPPEKPEPMIERLLEPPPPTEPPPTPKPAARKPAKPSAPNRPVTSTSSARAAAAAGTPNAGLPGGGSSNAQPRYRFNPKPVYPAEARRLKQQGRVLLIVEVSATGRPTNVTLKSGSGVPALDDAALAAVRRWSFEPARAAGVPIASRVEVPVQFNLTQ